VAVVEVEPDHLVHIVLVVEVLEDIENLLVLLTDLILYHH
tara:strand:+ start:87 stop:206 length:120 start_codon:yes stop_codon:yes gene_type:complete